MPTIDGNQLQKKLDKSLFSNKVIVFDTLESTNLKIKELASKGAQEGTVVLTDLQTKGKGRMGRSWISPRGKNLLMSILLKPSLQADDVFSVTMIFAMATIDALEKICGLNPAIKWPNDLYLNGKKVGGILTEFSLNGKAIDFIVIGLGLNVGWNPGEENGVSYMTTNLEFERGRGIRKLDLVTRMLLVFEDYYKDLLKGNKRVWREKWDARSMILGKRVRVDTGSAVFVGWAENIDANGALHIVDDQGEDWRFLWGDVSIEEVSHEDSGYRATS